MKSPLLLLIALLFAALPVKAQWQQLGSFNAGTNGMVNSMIHIGDTIYAGSQNGVICSSDNGGSWWQASPALSLKTVLSLCYYGGRLFAGVSGDGVYISDDLGTNWSLSNSGLSGTQVSCFTGNTDGIYAGTHDAGCFISVDSGATWTVINTGLTNTNITCITSCGDTIYAGTDGAGVFRSINMGTNWSVLNNNLPSWYITALYTYKGQIFLGSLDANLYRLSPGSSAWSNVSGGVPNYGEVLCFDDNGPVLFAGRNGTGVYYSIDGGSTWIEWNSGFVNRNIYALVVMHCSDVYASTSCGFGLWKRIFVPDPITLSSWVNFCDSTAGITAGGGIPPYTYLWNNGNTTTVISQVSPGTYSLTVTDAFCLSHTLVDSVEILDLLELSIAGDTTICAGVPTTLAIGGGGTSFLWSTGENSNPISVAPSASTTYTVTVDFGLGCVDTFSIMIHVDTCEITTPCPSHNIYIPNIFSPNGDGNNDIFLVRGISDWHAEFYVYDRWGEKVFYSDDPTVGWDGRFRGKMCEPGVYFYLLKASCDAGGSFQKTGNVSLVR